MSIPRPTGLGPPSSPLLDSRKVRCNELTHSLMMYSHCIGCVTLDGWPTFCVEAWTIQDGNSLSKLVEDIGSSNVALS